MKWLSLEASGLVAGAALFEDDRMLAECALNYGKTHSQTLLPLVDDLFGRLGWDKKDLDFVAVSSGPGSFTGLRIGSGVAKGIAMAVSVPIVEVPTLDAMAYSLFGAEGVISPIMDARRDQVYNGLFHYEGEKLVSLRENRPMSITELTSELNGMPEAAEKGVIFTGDGVPVFKDVIEETLKVPYTFAPVHVSRQSAGAVGALGKCLFDRGEYVSAAEHKPVYLRKSQAEREKEQRGG